MDLGYEKHLFSDPNSDVINVEYLAYKNMSGFRWYLYIGDLDSAYISLYPVRLYLVYDPENGVLIYDNYIKAVMKRYADAIEGYDFHPAVSQDEAIQLTLRKLDRSNLTLVKGPTPILLLPDNNKLRPYYYLEYVDSSNSIGYQVLVDAIDGSIDVYKGYLADANSSITSDNINSPHNNTPYNYIVGLSAIIIAVIIVSILAKQHRFL